MKPQRPVMIPKSMRSNARWWLILEIFSDPDRKVVREEIWQWETHEFKDLMDKLRSPENKHMGLFIDNLTRKRCFFRAGNAPQFMITNK